MNPRIQRLMTEAAALTRSGQLQRATAAIQAALAGAAGAVEPAPVVPAAAHAAREMSRDAQVIDVAATVVADPHARAPAPSPEDRSVDPRMRSDGGQFVDGLHQGPAGKRAYKLYVPPGLGGRPVPLVVMLHGCTQDPDDFAAGTRMNEAARQQGLLVLYPAQDRNANPSGCWNWFKHNHQQRDRGEPQLIAGMTRAVMKRHDVDPARVYVAGLSAGGAMAAILGEAYPDLYAAIGVHSGLPPGSAKDLPSALQAMKHGAGETARRATLPVIVFHGDRDATVHPLNAERVVASAGDRRVEVETSLSANGRRYTRASHRDRAGLVVAEHWTVHGAAHAWSGGDPRGSYTDAKGPDATAEMVRFFSTHARTR